MASSSSSTSSRTWRYRVFTSFHGPDVRKTFLSHLRKQFTNNGISMFDDQGIERSQTIAPALTQAIRESRISVVVLSKNYASSSWCLDELVEIFKCKEEIGQIVMTVFYGVDPSDVRNQTGEFGKVFKETCDRKTKEEEDRWSQALKDVGNIAGEHFLNWDNESKMIEKIAKDISNKLNATISTDFEDMVGIEAHLEKVKSLLHLDDEDGAIAVGICGPAGIGKTTIARALLSRLFSSFQLNCFMENIKGSCNSGLDEYGLKLCLQEQLLSKILNQNGMKVYHLGAIPERLCDQKVLIILDDVDDLQQLEALFNETNWFGPGSRIIVTTEDQEILEQHGINNVYHVDLPSDVEAHKIFCKYAFRQTFAPYGFENPAERVIKLCNNLPLGLCIMGSSLRGKKENEWECILHRLENSLDRKIERILGVGYDNLHKDDQLMFLLIACFFNYQDNDHVMLMLGDSNLDVTLGLKTLICKSLIKKSSQGNIVMHKLLQQVGKQATQRQEPWKRQVLIDTNEILDVLENDSGGRSLMGISFDISTMVDNINISAKAFKNMRNLQFLRIYKTRRDTNVRVHIPEDMDFPPRLRLLHWEVYPTKCLPPTFCPQHLVELKFRDSKLEKLWEGAQHLPNLKTMYLIKSSNLKELPDLTNATNLKSLDLSECSSLVEIHSSLGNLHKLESLVMDFCINLRLVPNLFHLRSLRAVCVGGCGQLRKVPDCPTNITRLTISETMVEEFTESIRLWSRLQCLAIYSSVFSHSPSLLEIERIPDCIKDLHELYHLYIVACLKLASLPELPRSLTLLRVHYCESLETLTPFPLDSSIQQLSFSNCIKLGREAKRVITQQASLRADLPGRTIPAEFQHRALGNSLSIRSDVFRFKICVVVSVKQRSTQYWNQICWCRIHIIGGPTKKIRISVHSIKSEHLFIFGREFREEDGRLEQNSEILFDFSTTSQNIEIIEVGVQVLDGNKPTEAEAAKEAMSRDQNNCLTEQ